MPTYDYKCEHCGLNFEKFQGINDKPLETCPECGGQVRRLIGAGAGILIKNSVTGGSQTRCGKKTTCCGMSEPCAQQPSCDK